MSSWVADPHNRVDMAGDLEAALELIKKGDATFGLWGTDWDTALKPLQ